MAGGPLRVVATAGAAVAAGMFTLSMASSVSLNVLSTVVEKRRKKTAPPCACCKGRGFTECRLCKGESTIDWSPLYDPVISKPCICPTCDGNKVQKCLNCVGKGYVWLLCWTDSQNNWPLDRGALWMTVVQRLLCVNFSETILSRQMCLDMWVEILHVCFYRCQC